jgi:hypothetical protein
MYRKHPDFFLFNLAKVYFMSFIYSIANPRLNAQGAIRRRDKLGHLRAISYGAISKTNSPAISIAVEEN